MDADSGTGDGGVQQGPCVDIAGGILYHEGDLIVGVPPGIYRLHDTNGDGKTDWQTTISEGFYTHPTYGGHGISGVTIGPDGRLYWEVGDMGMHVVDAAGRAWSYPNQGVVVRSELDGSGFEVFASGIRNLQEFSFDEHANLISVDNDGDHQGETERLVYLTYGSDTGWRSNWQYGNTPIPRTTATTCGWPRACSRRVMSGSRRISCRRSRHGMRDRRGWPSILEPRCRTSGASTSSSPAFRAAPPTRGSTGSPSTRTARDSRWGPSGRCFAAS